MKTIWKGSISFGLINIPVKIYTAVHESTLDLDMLDSRDHSKIKFKRVNENTGKEVEYKDIVKGYKINDVNLQAGNLSATLNKVSLLSESTAKKNTDFYGNLGQDYISQFNEMIINFKNSFIRFEN